ncbi:MULTISPECIES: Gfo/Idh/MocA family protein [unclassified Nocardioides]|uniref:Gfo/Idh/MocA family protein n=1 Tax=unclassified Nocardioides TaxID=2615069 RepID=UPI0009F0B7CD|nr:MULTISPECIES: Gfo/Idh/MocA family oxidoreductase [unclassified Nocardioides]GAW51289.1 Oxidoreductase [Nocardioides sp. PD653-B2]GAW52636.1 Oxidoreductase [Nocardioides sp. PD653]
MASPQRLNVVVVGLGFGAEFVPIYRVHPDVATVGLCDVDAERADRLAATYGADRVYPSLEAVLDDDEVDAVHLVTPLTEHGLQSIATLRAGKHCASTVPMAVDERDLSEIIALERSTGLTYMMMETAVFTREFLHVKGLVARGELGSITFARGAHYQDMSGWPPYWEGLPPMWYGTHAVAPLLALLDTHAVEVHCFGSGRLDPAEESRYGNPYPAETAIFRLHGHDAALEVTRSLSRVARPYTESFDLYGDRGGFEWSQLEEDETPLLFAMGDPEHTRHRPITVTRLKAPETGDLLPPSLARFTREGVYGADGHLSVAQGSGHGGSHPHLVHEFIRSIVEDRPSLVDAQTAARWTAAGLTAHRSAIAGGTTMSVPTFD